MVWSWSFHSWPVAWDGAEEWVHSLLGIIPSSCAVLILFSSNQRNSVRLLQHSLGHYFIPLSAFSNCLLCSSVFCVCPSTLAPSLQPHACPNFPRSHLCYFVIPLFSCSRGVILPLVLSVAFSYIFTVVPVFLLFPRVRHLSDHRIPWLVLRVWSCTL